jgi:hypothetical protein
MIEARFPENAVLRRLEKVTAVCFLQVTRNLNWRLLRLEKDSGEWLVASDE